MYTFRVYYPSGNTFTIKSEDATFLTEAVKMATDDLHNKTIKGFEVLHTDYANCGFTRTAWGNCR